MCKAIKDNIEMSMKIAGDLTPAIIEQQHGCLIKVGGGEFIPATDMADPGSAIRTMDRIVRHCGWRIKSADEVALFLPDDWARMATIKMVAGGWLEESKPEPMAAIRAVSDYIPYRHERAVNIFWEESYPVLQDELEHLIGDEPITVALEIGRKWFISVRPVLKEVQVNYLDLEDGKEKASTMKLAFIPPVKEGTVQKVKELLHWNLDRVALRSAVYLAANSILMESKLAGLLNFKGRRAELNSLLYDFWEEAYEEETGYIPSPKNLWPVIKWLAKKSSKLKMPLLEKLTSLEAEGFEVKVSEKGDADALSLLLEVTIQKDGKSVSFDGETSEDQLNKLVEDLLIEDQEENQVF